MLSSESAHVMLIHLYRSYLSIMVVSDAIHNIMGGIENTGDVRLHNHRRKLKQRFDIVKKLGQGTYGKVQLGINKETGQEVAIKTIRKCKIETEADLIRIRREIQIMSSVRHPNIIHIYEVFENREKMVLVMEYAAGGELYDYLSERKVLSEDEARRIFRQIATAIYYCHKHNICHRDLKLENILLDEVGNAKIADFGLSNVFSYSSLLSTFCGSPLYASPEIVKGTPYHGPEVDCWSLGVLLYTLVYGAMPFDGSNFKRLVKQISTGNYFEPKYPSPASPLIAEMLSVNPARRADISAICSHCWINETYSETCLEVAEELARQTPVRLDLLLSLTAPLVTPENIVTSIQVPNNEDVNGTLSRPIRSQSLGSIPPAAVVAPNVLPFTLPEAKESVIPEDRKPKIKKKERSHSRTRRKERSRSRPRKSVDGESFEQDEEKLVQDQVLRNTQQTTTSLLNSDTQIIVKPVEQKSNDAESRSLPTELCETKESFENDSKSKSKPVERRRSKVFEAAEKFSAANEKSVGKVPPPKKIILPGISIDGAKKEFERRTSLVGSNESNSPPNKNCISDTNPPEDELFPLASTVALNKLVESAFRDEPLVDKLLVPVELDNLVEGNLMKVTPKVNNSEVHNSKAATLPRRKTCTAEIQLVTPQLPPDNYKTEVEHFINKPPVSHKTEIVIPIAAPLPPKSLTKQDNQSKEHIIPIHLEQETPRKGTSPSSSWSASKSSIPRTSSSSLSRQSTVDSDSGSTISTGEPIRKSPREVIIPIAVEGGGYVTPREDTLTRISSVNDSEDESKSGSRCFTLRSTKRRQPEQNQAAQVDNADSLSSDEDDNFQLLTAENLFSTLLSRVRSLTQRLNNDDMRRSSAFPRSLFQHCKIFDNVPSRRLTETRSFSRPESAPWRRGITSNSQPERDDSFKKHYSRIAEEKTPFSSQSVTTNDFKSRSSSFSSKMKVEEVAEPAKSESRDSAEPKSAIVPKVSIEDEFNAFFSKYKKNPVDSNKFNYARKQQTPFVGRPSPAPKSETPVPVDEKTSKKPPRRSRFLRPDFYDTPREESKYVIQNEKVRAFRERSLSRQRDLSRNRSVDSFSNGLSTDYVRSKTCSITDQMENLQKRDFRRTTSDDTATITSSKDDRLQDLNTAKRKSVMLQNELENEIRKTQNMNSKLSDLMLALNDSENQYERKLEKLYGLKMKKMAVNNEAADQEPETTAVSELRPEPKTVPADELKSELVEQETKPESKSDKEETNYNKLSLLEKKFAYFRKLQSNGEQSELTCDRSDQLKDTPTLNTSASNASGSSPEHDTSSLTTPPDDMDSDAWSMISDGMDTQYQDNMNDRIRRRSFYSRFNNYKQKPTTSSIIRIKPLTYSRSLSADFRRRSDNFSRPI